MGKEQKLNRGNIIISCLIVVISLMTYFVLIPSQIHNPPQVKSMFLKPSFAPRVYTVFLGLLGFILLLKEILVKKIGLASEKSIRLSRRNDKLDKKYISEKEKLALLIIFVCVIIVILINYIGIVVSSILFLLFVIIYFGQQRLWLIVIIAIVVPLILFIFFHELAKVIFPKGILFSLEQFI